ncbi:MAG TPA: BTAD domain-containing putative transcriptional regulator [Gemmatimonadales bacterium]|nr:BTAD domain-containing putative transcriptional regulator [Gemmatimonadales bacterium]
MLRLKTLGGLSVHGDSGPVTGAAGQRRRLALLALLARAGERGLTRDKLLGVLWPDAEPDKGRSVLAQALYALRRDLGSDQLFLGTIEVRLNPEVISSDAAEFAAALAAGRPEDAAALYGGPFLDGFYVSGAPEFERWVEVERTALAHDFTAVLERLATTAGAGGDHLAAVGWWRKLAAADPLSSRVAVGLMRAMADAGDRAGAIQHARIYQTLLRQEIEADPDPEVVALAERLRQEPARRVSPSPARAPQPAAPVEVATTESPPRAGRRPNPALWIAAVCLTLLAAGIGARRIWWNDGATDGRKMVAVLPFENLGAPEDEYFADGLSEEVTARLANISGLGVISRTSSKQYKKTGKSLKEIGRELGAAYVLEGSVRWTRGPEGTSRVRVTPQLIRVSDDSHLWADRFDADLADIFQVQGRIAERVADALHVALGAPQRQALSEPLTDDLAAYDAYIQGNAYLDRAWGDDRSLRRAVELFQQAVDRDPGFATALARLSVGHTMMFRLGYDATEQRLGQAKAALDDAFRLRPGLTEAHVALGYYHYWGRRAYPEAQVEFRRALDQRPNDPDAAFGLGAVERRRGNWPDAVRYLRQAAELDPRSSNKAWDCGLALFLTRDYRESELYLDRAIALAPNWGYPYTSKARLYLSWTGDTARARRVLREAVDQVRLADLATGTNDAAFLLAGDSALRRRLGAISLEEFDGDSVLYHMWKGFWHRYHGDKVRELAAWDSMRIGAEAFAEQRRHREASHPAEAEQPLVPLAIAYAGLGRTTDALRVVDRALELLPVAKDAAWGADRGIYFALIYTWLGERRRAVQELARLVSVPSPLSPIRLRVDPAWDPLREDTGFRRLVAEK